MCGRARSTCRPTPPKKTSPRAIRPPSTGPGPKTMAPMPNRSAPATVKFYYDHKTHWVADSVNKVIAVVTGNFQAALGCAKDNDPTYLRSWLEDPAGSGTYAFVTAALPAGTYTAQ